MIPTIATGRPRPRHWPMKDFEPRAALGTGAGLQKYAPGGAETRESARESLCAAAGEWPIRGPGVFPVAGIETDLAAGFAGFRYPVHIGGLELCRPPFHGNEGRGYAAEAAAARGRAYEDKALPPLMSFSHPGNAASIAVAERPGAGPETQTALPGAPRPVYRHIGRQGA